MAEHRGDPELFWVDPRRRGVIPLDGFHISRSLARRLRRDDYSVTRDRDFDGVVNACGDRADTWINAELHDLYRKLFELGHAHSIEVWMDGALAGGVFGITVGGAFCGESMFSQRTDGSKIALAFLVDHVRRSGFTLFDTQFLTDHLASLGGVEVTRTTYRRALADALKQDPDFTRLPLARTGQDVLQRNTQTS